MATNALLIEFGVDRRFSEEDQAEFQRVIGQLETWKSENRVETYRLYMVVTGNRSQRVGLILIDVDQAQLEALVSTKDYGDWTEDVAALGCNFTSNRAITMERMMQMMQGE